MEKLVRVKLRAQYCGPRGNHGTGCEIEVPENEAAQLCAGGYAEPAEGAKAVSPQSSVPVSPKENLAATKRKG